MGRISNCFNLTKLQIFERHARPNRNDQQVSVKLRYCRTWMINSDRPKSALPSLSFDQPPLYPPTSDIIRHPSTPSNVPDVLWLSIAPHEETGWPADLVARAGMGVRGLVPRGTLFERYMTCLVEPTRNGLYQSLDKALLLRHFY